MDALALASLILGAVSEAVVVAIIVALGTGGPALIFSIYKWRQTGPEEHDALVTQAASQAVEMMDTAIKAAVREREEDRRRIVALERRVDELEKAWPDGHLLPAGT